MSQEQPPFGLPGPILAEIQRRPRSRIKFNCPPSVVPETQFSSTRYLYKYVILKDYKGGCKKIIKGYKGINFL